MKLSYFLLLIIFMMQGTALVNVTLFENNWNGLMLWINTSLFIIATALTVKPADSSHKDH
ncbi:hypothetical protein JF544_11255 [Halobacillus kuroshimensis]|uniref:Uncharacterized protein n=1 Tax=Halobacillus kuroshimensis TaxID=302481 RepID=A0ABS3DWV9_9BACI|nr:hypothetical protein [Halobacillus kuroshimensis]MBN8235830.1 hypothetical protein [Halobacillus kuroshimensis]